MRTCVRGTGGHDPARRPRRVLRLGRAARRSAPARPAGHRRRRASCSPPATRPRRCGVRTAMGGAQARRLCPQAVVVPPRMSAYSEASKAVFEVFDDTTPLVEGLSIDEAFLDVGGLRRVSGTPTEIAVRLRRDVLERVGLPITVGRGPHQVPRQGGQRRGQARRPAGGAARRRARLPAPAAGRAAVGRRPGDRRASCTTAASGPSARSPSSPRRRWCRYSGAASGRHLHALAHNRDPRPVQVGRRRRSIGSQRALGRARRGRPTTSTPSSSASSTGSPAGCAPPGGSAARSCCGCASTTSPGPPARTRCPQATAAHPGRSSPRRARCSPTAMPMIEQPGPHAASAWRVRQPRQTTRDPARPAVRRPARQGARRRARRRARPVRIGRRSPGPCCSAATRA